MDMTLMGNVGLSSWVTLPSKSTGFHPIVPWTTRPSMQFTILGTLGPHRSASRSPTCSRRGKREKKGKLLLSLNPCMSYLFPREGEGEG